MIVRATKCAARPPRRYNLYLRDWWRFAAETQSVHDERFEMRWSDRMPSLWENSVTTSFDAHYIYHTAWAVRMVTRLAPAKHVDISSTLYFCASPR
jgi:hypothetical protein